MEILILYQWINFLIKLKFSETVRLDGPKSHAGKSGTPTMGGLMIISSLLISAIFWGNLRNYNFLLLCGCALSFSLLGFRDDYEKAILKIKGGMRSRTKFLITLALGIALTYIYFYITGTIPGRDREVLLDHLPVQKDAAQVLNPLFSKNILIIFWLNYWNFYYVDLNKWYEFRRYWN
jgi:UDP-N-acetylmuramyl pentapeptide phosphotransferase/UDP-N-acetylglucosamine-1-phosphate transferase